MVFTLGEERDSTCNRIVGAWEIDLRRFETKHIFLHKSHSIFHQIPLATKLQSKLTKFLESSVFQLQVCRYAR